MAWSAQTDRGGAALHPYHALPLREASASLSEGDADAAPGGADAALVGHRNAFHRTEQRDVPGGVIIEAGAEHRTHRAALAGCREGKTLPDQHGVDGGIADTLLCDHAAMHAGLQGVVAAEEGRRLRHFELAALLEILQRAAEFRCLLYTSDAADE